MNNIKISYLDEFLVKDAVFYNSLGVRNIDKFYSMIENDKKLVQLVEKYCGIKFVGLDRTIENSDLINQIEVEEPIYYFDQKDFVSGFTREGLENSIKEYCEIDYN